MAFSFGRLLGSASRAAGPILDERAQRQALAERERLAAEDRSRRLTLEDRLAERQRTQDAEAAKMRTLDMALKQKKKYNPAKFSVGGKAVQGFATEDGQYLDANLRPVVGDVAPYEEPREARTPNMVPVDEPTPQGGVRRVLRPEKEGLEVPGPSNIMAGSATLKKAVADNRVRSATIKDALSELAVHPKAVGGLLRTFADIVPLFGTAMEKADQRIDPEGINARASLANIGSLVIHDRSGAAVTVSEFPRLAPFIPQRGDTYDAVVKKLTKLADLIELETGELERSMSTRPAASDRPATTKRSADDYLRARGVQP